LEEWFPIFQFLKIIALERYLSVFENEYSHASYQVKTEVKNMMAKKIELSTSSSGIN
jgi:hypothetical protein